MHVAVLTTFPELFVGAGHTPLTSSIPKRAQERGALTIAPTNIRDFTDPPHHKTDDRPFGGGPGMVMLAEPLVRAAEHAEAALSTTSPTPPRRILLSPQGAPFTQQTAERLAEEHALLLICGHYEGIDERAIDHLVPTEISLGDYVLSSGELAAMVLIDAVARLLPGVLGHGSSAAEDSFSPLPTADPNGDTIPPKQLARWLNELTPPTTERVRTQTNTSETHQPPRLLDCPHYTRPRVWRGSEAPGVLFSGDHAAVYKWRLEQMLARTAARRPDLLPPAQ